jgi:hypothetical protein
MILSVFSYGLDRSFLRIVLKSQLSSASLPACSAFARVDAVKE